MSVVEEVYVPPQRRSATTAFLLTGAAIAAVLAVYWETSWSLVSTWLRSDTFAHGMLVFPASLYLIWTHRRALTGAKLTVNPAGLAALAALTAVWVLARVADLLVVQQFALVAMVPALAWILLGWRFVRTMAFPLAFLAFAVPFGDGLIPILMEFTATFTVFALELTGIPVYREGLYFSIPSGDFEVATACSGIRYLIGSVSLGCLYAYLMYRSLRRRLIFVAISAVVPIVANGIRAYLIVLIAHLSDMKLAVGVDHLVYGWLFFGIVMFLLFWIGRAFREDDPDEHGSRDAPLHLDSPRSSHLLTAMLAALAIVALGPVFYERVSNAADRLSVDYAPRLPAGVGPWVGPEAVTSSWRPEFVGAQVELAGRYRSAAGSVHLHIVGYPRQAQGAELINANNRLYDGTDWRLLGRDRHAGVVAAVPSLRELRLRSKSTSLRVWTWYRAGERDTVSDVAVKWSEVSRVLRGQADSAALVAVAAEDDEEGRGADVLAAFLEVHGEALAACIDDVAADGCAP